MYIITLAVVSSLSMVLGQNADNTIAILDFKPTGISKIEAEKITDRLRAQLDETGAVRQMNREWTYDVLRREGIKKIDCITAECTADLGNYLNVDYAVTGELVKAGDSTFIIDINMVHVPSRITKKSKRITVEGDLGDVVVEMEMLAWNMLWLQPPELLLAKKRLGRDDPSVMDMIKPRTRQGALKRSIIFPGMGSIYRGNIIYGCIFMGLEVTFIGLAFDRQTAYEDLDDDKSKYLTIYKEATRPDSIAKYVGIIGKIDQDMKKVNSDLLLYSASAVGVWALSMAHAYYARQKEDEFSTHPQALRFAYDPIRKQARLSWFF